VTNTLPLIQRAAARGFPNVMKCEWRGCPVVLFTQAATTRCRAHRKYAGRCCGDRLCGYGARRVF
jgi:hypothetical protein